MDLQPLTLMTIAAAILLLLAGAPAVVCFGVAAVSAMAWSREIDRPDPRA